MLHKPSIRHWLLMSIILSLTLALLFASKLYQDGYEYANRPTEYVTETPNIVNSVEDVIETPIIPLVAPTISPNSTPTPVVEVEKITFRVTAYCSCEKCCGKWALNRPVDENGEQIVNGASGERLVVNVSCASPLPFGTRIELDGYGVVEVQDRIAQWVVDKYGENIIDIYMTDHQSAWNWGEQFIEGVILNDSTSRDNAN